MACRIRVIHCKFPSLYPLRWSHLQSQLRLWGCSGWCSWFWQWTSPMLPAMQCCHLVVCRRIQWRWGYYVQCYFGPYYFTVMILNFHFIYHIFRFYGDKHTTAARFTVFADMFSVVLRKEFWWMYALIYFSLIHDDGVGVTVVTHLGYFRLCTTSSITVCNHYPEVSLCISRVVGVGWNMGGRLTRGAWLARW